MPLETPGKDWKYWKKRLTPLLKEARESGVDIVCIMHTYDPIVSRSVFHSIRNCGIKVAGYIFKRFHD